MEFSIPEIAEMCATVTVWITVTLVLHTVRKLTKRATRMLVMLEETFLGMVIGGSVVLFIYTISQHMR